LGTIHPTLLTVIGAHEVPLSALFNNIYDFAAIDHVKDWIATTRASAHLNIGIGNGDGTIFIGSRCRRRQKYLQYDGNQAPAPKAAN
jgi:hypothetical protein